MYEYLSQLDRFLHVLFGIVWIGLLYYFNFVGAGYLKEATPDAKKDVLQKLQPKALWYFRWAALLTFLTGLYLLYYVSEIPGAYNVGISLGATMATIMFLNVWLIIWPNQKKVIAGAQDAAEAGAKAALASRTNTLFSFPMLYFMIYSAHINYGNDPLLIAGELGPGWSSYSLWIGILLIVLIQLNAMFGKMRKWFESVKAVIHSGAILTVAFATLVYFY
ncbi:MAG: urate hydroxylase PuuD [Gammaproteobacteria bacterium]|uniref:Antitermination protein NusG n=1 Tax=SAR86 cluster bacterium TaxID=2030880 RepID=A0A520N1A0_9GAMM|nr:urate hydroxylase PuuD [SAR86 cluster bacterium]RZO27258.1 MAG: antitermination protein NusG [SAR86 cluster bacterium]|tara:strand:- start:1718 stop:2377 length:660 start_codon:yes stop_codon:yes gene_type:complete